MEVSKLSFSCQSLSLEESQDDMRFNKSLQELKDLRSQLHYAADYCERSFFRSEEKKVLMEETQQYICKAVVTLVDHLGNVSSNLDGLLSENGDFSDAELRLDCLNQKLATCQQYTHKLALAQLRWSVLFPRYNSLYISQSTVDAEKSDQASRKSDILIAAKSTKKQELQGEKKTPLSYNPKNQRSSPRVNPILSKFGTINRKSHSALESPADGGLSLPKAQTNPPFHFQYTLKRGHSRRRKLVWRNEFLPFVRHSRQLA